MFKIMGIAKITDGHTIKGLLYWWHSTGCH